MTQYHIESTFSDLINILPENRLLLQRGVHPLENLLQMEPEEILQYFKESQEQDFTALIKDLEKPDSPLQKTFAELQALADRHPEGEILAGSMLTSERLMQLFLDLHSHVMDHPVWRHPFFIRFFHGDFTADQLREFSRHYFNQIKNTRQCVALAIGRFSGVSPRHHGILSERVSEITQIVLAQLVADEYGVSTHSLEDYPSLDGILKSTTHIAMYRQLFEGLNMPFQEQDVPLIQGVADNVLIQRLVAGNDSFTHLESLASVGLGMEWGVPEFFSLLLGGIIRFAYRNQTPITRRHLHVFIAHVQYDVMHAISVMLVTALHIVDENSIQSIKGAVNTLMSGRHAMMTDLYRHVFGERCPSLNESNLEERYQLTDRRIENELLIARQKVAEGTVENLEAYRERRNTPFVYRNIQREDRE